LYGLNFTLHELLKNKQVAAIAKKYNVSVPQLGIRYCLQPDMLSLPKTEVLTTNFLR
jgi:diketogulonate reductase-like aldo/keto reductase